MTALLVISIRRSEGVIRSQRHISDALLMDNSSLLHLNARSFPGVSLWVREICQWAERSILVTGPKTDLEPTLTVKALVMPLYSGFHIVQSDLLVGVPPAKKKRLTRRCVALSRLHITEKSWLGASTASLVACDSVASPLQYATLE